MSAGQADQRKFTFHGVDVRVFSIDGGDSKDIALIYQGQFLTSMHYVGISWHEAEHKAEIEILKIEHAWRSRLRLAIGAIERERR